MLGAVVFHRGDDLRGQAVSYTHLDVYKRQLVAECAAHGDVAAGFKRGARAGCDVCAKRGDRVAHGRAELNGEALDGVGVVAAPDLRGIIQHAGIETSAAAGAVFKEDIRKRFDKTIHEVVCTEHEAVHDLLLALRREQRRADLGQIAVEIPFDVINLIFTEMCIRDRCDPATYRL